MARSGWAPQAHEFWGWRPVGRCATPNPREINLALIPKPAGVQANDANSTRDPRLGTASSGTYRAQQRTLHDDDLRAEADKQPSLEKDRFLLTILTGPAKGTVFKLDREVLTVGRADEADITIPDLG